MEHLPLIGAVGAAASAVLTLFVVVTLSSIASEAKRIRILLERQGSKDGG